MMDMQLFECFNTLVSQIMPPDPAAMRKAMARWDGVAKPIGSLGLFEDALVRICGLTGNENIALDNRAVLVFCADNGVVAEGVTQTGPEVTALVARNIVCNTASVCRMAEIACARVIPVDVGMLLPVEGTVDLRIAPGTGNITKGPAMTRAQAISAMLAGADLVLKCKQQGVNIIATGEMGIGNTTTSSAMAAVLLNMPAENVTGRGAGLSDLALSRKIRAIQTAIRVNRPDPDDPVDVLQKLGGFDLAAMTGAFLGGAVYRVPIIIDGFISAIAALTAARIAPSAKCAMFASHVSAEPAAALALNALALSPVLRAEMRLGEGTGAVMALPLFAMALKVYEESASFAQIGMAPYVPQEGKSAQ